MPEKSLFMALLGLIFLPGSQMAVQIMGRTIHEMHFSGNLTTIENDFLRVHYNENQQLSIPVRSLKYLTIQHDQLSRQHILELLKYDPLLPLWSPEVQNLLIENAALLAQEEAWSECFHAVKKLLQAFSKEKQLLQLKELEAWSLFELGLFHQSSIVLDEMHSRVDPISASTRYCWLKAKMALKGDDVDGALFWSKVPDLKIPRDESPLGDDLRTISNNINSINQ